MNIISPSIPLIVGIISGSIFIILFIGALVVTMRNRRLIRRYSDYRKNSLALSSDLDISESAQTSETSLFLKNPD
ncbi:MAG: hypothetical protein K2G85_07235 [Muribaculaceae bacterium]|nr:hypothetical protein [Muribaculaceae bacterium]